MTTYCDAHDRAYSLGALIGHDRALPMRLVLRHLARRDADTLFLSGIHGEASSALQADVTAGRWLPVPRFAARVLVAWVYYLGVRLLGWTAYPWRRHAS